MNALLLALEIGLAVVGVAIAVGSPLVGMYHQHRRPRVETAKVAEEEGRELVLQ